tara:strand:- start:9330 stop:9542 length:213 start_codon:yes stop_codon:yes gene_type:complete
VPEWQRERSVRETFHVPVVIPAGMLPEREFGASCSWDLVPQWDGVLLAMNLDLPEPWRGSWPLIRSTVTK